MRCTIVAAVLCLTGAAAAQPQAQIETTLGTITVDLDSARAPKTVANFIRYAKEGHYDGTMIYRVVPGFVIQAGSTDPKGNGRALHDPIPLESGNGLHNVRGAIAMAREDTPASATAEFFIDLADNTYGLDPKPGDAPGTTGYAVFGHVSGGMEVADKIAAVPLNGGVGPFPDADPATPVIIKKMTISDTAP